MCDRFVFAQMLHTNANKPTCSRTPCCSDPSGPSPVCPILAHGQQVSHREETWLTLAFGSWPGCPPVKLTLELAHTALAHKCTNAYASNTHTEGDTHIHSGWHLSVFWQADRGPLALHPHNCATRWPSAPSISVTWNISRHISPLACSMCEEVRRELLEVLF